MLKGSKVILMELRRWPVVLLLLTALALMAPSIAIAHSRRAGLLIVPDDFASIQEAINASDEGGLIIIKGGTYSEALTITKSLTLGAEGKVILTHDRDQPIILIEKAQDVRIEGIELRYNRIGVEVQSSNQISLTRMTIAPASPYISNAAISARDSQVRIEGGTIVGGSKGIELQGTAKADIVGNVITKAIIAGVFVGDQSQASIVENIINSNLLAGIALSDRGIAYIKKNSIGSNELDGIAVFPEARATITENIIQGNGGCGIWADARATVRAWDNKVFENKQGDFCGAVSEL